MRLTSSKVCKKDLFKYNVETGEFKMVEERLLWTIQNVVGDKLVGSNEYSGSITVIDLKTDEILVYDEVISLHD